MHCGFNFPIPPMQKTQILEPMEFHNAKTKENGKVTFDALNNMEHDDTCKFW